METRRLLGAAHTTTSPRHLALLDEIERTDGAKDFDKSELVELSVKLSPGALSRNRYDSAIEWTPAGIARFPESVRNGAPSAALAGLLSVENDVFDWIRASGRFFSYLAVDGDERLYKIYLFDTTRPAFLDEIDPRAPAEEVLRRAYIDCLEIDVDQPARRRRAPYFKLRAPSLASVLDEGFRPAPSWEGRALVRLPERRAIADAVRALLRGVGRMNDPVIKLRLDGRDDLRDVDATISANVVDARCLKYVNDHTAEIRAIAKAFACSDEVEAWLDAIRPFDCFVSYLGLSEGAVTLYYKSTTLLARRPAGFVRG